VGLALGLMLKNFFAMGLQIYFASFSRKKDTRQRTKKISVSALLDFYCVFGQP
jgi:hypothetical protein